MNGLSEWMNAIREIGEAGRVQENARLTAMEAALPAAIARLASRPNVELFQLLDQFAGGAFNPREDRLREEFSTYIKAEMLSRMTDK